MEPSRERNSKVAALLEFMSTQLWGSHREAERLCPIFWSLKSSKCCLQGMESHIGDRAPLQLSQLLLLCQQSSPSLVMYDNQCIMLMDSAGQDRVRERVA